MMRAYQPRQLFELSQRQDGTTLARLRPLTTQARSICPVLFVLSMFIQQNEDRRRAKNRRAKAYLQYVAARRFERNEAYGSFSAAC